MKRKENDFFSVINNSLWDLPSPSSMSYFWNFGSTLGIVMSFQIITGILLSFHYTSFASYSFSSLAEIMREVWFGWSMRMIHMNTASLFFAFIYLHMMRGLFFSSVVHKEVWISGVSIMILLMAISFLGYVLPWGQMSYWAVAVITNLFSVVPILQESLVHWIWGSFSVSTPTLTRFYSLHFMLPFMLAFLVLIHMISLHSQGSSNPLGLNSNMDKISFHPYFSVKDLFYIFTIFFVALMMLFLYPYFTGDSLNNIPANPMKTPTHIQPEWYFLSSYAILRALPSKTAGVIALLLSVSIFYILPMYQMKFSVNFSMLRKYLFWTFFACFLFLMKMGSLPAEEPFIFMSKIGASIYFTIILLINI